MNKIFLKASLISVLATPFFVLAGEPLSSIKDLVTAVGGIINLLIPMAFGLALLFFFYGIAVFILKSGDEKGREEGKKILVWGVIALAVAASIWGITNFIRDAVGIDKSMNSVTVPTFK